MNIKIINEIFYQNSIYKEIGGVIALRKNDKTIIVCQESNEIEIRQKEDLVKAYRENYKVESRIWDKKLNKRGYVTKKEKPDFDEKTSDEQIIKYIINYLNL